MVEENGASATYKPAELLFTQELCRLRLDDICKAGVALKQFTPTLLNGEVLVVWQAIPVKTGSGYAATKQARWTCISLLSSRLLLNYNSVNLRDCTWLDGSHVLISVEATP